MPALLDSVLAAIRERRDEFKGRYGIWLVGFVGSVARGDDDAESDIDIVYDISGARTLFTLSRAQFELENALGRAVDLVDPKSMRSDWRDYIERDLVLA